MSAELIFALEFTAVVEGVEQSFYFSTARFATGPNDQPAHQPFRPLIDSAGTFARQLFSGKRMTGYVAPSYGQLTLANPTDETGKGVLDDFATYGVSGGRVVLRVGQVGAAYPDDWTLVYIARAQKVSVQPGSMVISLRDLSEMLDKPVVSDVFTGSGGLEGSGAGLGRKKQFVTGDPGFIPPILIDAAKQIYYVQSSGTSGYADVDTSPAPRFGVWDNGIPLSRVWPNYSSEAELLASALGEGEVRFYFGGAPEYGHVDGPVAFRIGSPPAGDLRVYTLGYSGPTDWARLGRATGTYTLAVMAARAGVPVSLLQDPAADGVSMGAQLIEAEQTYLEAMSSACLVHAGWFGFGRDEQFRSGYLADPDDEGVYYGLSLPELPAQAAQPTTSVYTFTHDTIKELRSDPPAGADAPTWCVTISTGRAWPSRIAGAAEAYIKGWLTREPYYDSFKAYSDATLIAHPRAERAEVVAPSRDLQNDFSRRLASARYLYLYGGTPRTYTFRAKMTEQTLAIDLHDVVTLQTPRFGLGAGVKFRVVGITIEASARQISFTVWAPGRGVYSGSTSPLDPGTEEWTQAQATAAQIAALMKVRIPPFSLFSYGTVAAAPAASGGPIYIPAFSLISAGEIADVPSDPDFSSVVALLHFEIDWSTSGADSSTYDRTVTSYLADRTSSSPLTGSWSAESTEDAAYVYYTGGSELIVGSSDWTFEMQISVAASGSQTSSYLVTLNVPGSGGSSWAAGAFYLAAHHIGDAAWQGVPTFWAYNYSTTAPLLIGTTDLRGAGPKVVCVERSGNTWRLYVDGVVEATQTWSGSLTSIAQNRQILGGIAAAWTIGKIDEVRETIGVARYGGAYTPELPFPDQ